MKPLICELCNGNDIVKQDGFFVCQHCGTKYTIEEARKLMGTVKIDKTEETQNLLVLARRARDENNSENAEKYYGMILEANPNSWEAAFFQVYYRAMQCKVGEIGYYADAVGNSLLTVATLIDEADQDEKNLAVKTIIVPCFEIAELFASVATDHYNKHMSVDGVFQECVNTNVNASVIIGKLEIVVKEYCDDKNVIVALQKQYVTFLNSHSKFFNKNYLNETITRLSNEIKQVDTSYATPTVNSGGCYVATAVYGSYDCPEVWTLRRFRDNTLAETWYGRVFINTYYAISPTLVKWFGNTNWFKNMWKPALDKMVKKLNNNGVDNTAYNDREW